jgi:hypothetical protein
MLDAPARIRQRQRAAGGWRIWWEPEAAVRGLGFAAVELYPKRLTWSGREAVRLNGLVAEARARASPVAEVGGGRTMSALIAAFTMAPAWTELRPDTQRDYRGGFRIIDEKWGGWQVVLFRRGIVLEWFEALHRDRGAYQAKSIMRKLSLLMSYAERREWIEANPCLRLRIPTPAPRDRVVQWHEFDALLAAAAQLGHDGMALAIAIGWFTDQRRHDILTATAGQVGADGVWRFTRSKAAGGSAQAPGAIKLHSELPRWSRRASIWPRPTPRRCAWTPPPASRSAMIWLASGGPPCATPPRSLALPSSMFSSATFAAAGRTGRAKAARPIVTAPTAWAASRTATHGCRRPTTRRRWPAQLEPSMQSGGRSRPSARRVARDALGLVGAAVRGGGGCGVWIAIILAAM